VQHWRGIFGSHGATFSNNYRHRLVDWFLENPRPDYAIAPNQPACIGDLNDDGDPKLEERIKNDLAVTVRCIPLDGQKLCDDQGRPGTCPFTGEPSAKRVVWAKSY
jgi:hypothetical protein